MRSSGSQKFLKFVGVLSIIGALLIMLCGGLIAALSSNAEFVGKITAAVKEQAISLPMELNKTGIITIGVAIAVIGIVYLLYGICMLRAGKDANKTLGALIFAVLGLILNGAALINAIRNSAGISRAVGSAAVSLIILLSVLTVRKERS